MTPERLFRSGDEATAFDWSRPARELDVPLETARALYVRAMQLLLDARRAEALYRRWLRDAATARQQTGSPPVPGRQTRVLRELEKAGKPWEPAELEDLAPGKWTRALLEHSDEERLPGADEAQLAIRALTGTEHGRPSLDPTQRTPAAASDAQARGLPLRDDPAASTTPSLVERNDATALPRRPRDRMWDLPLDGAMPIPGVAGAMFAQPAQRPSVALFRRPATVSGTPDPEHPAVAEALRRRGSGEPLPEPVRRDMEARLGADLRRVRVHTDAVAQRAAAAVQARAFTVGEDVFFAQGAFQPDSAGGRELLAHELAHVVQGHRGQLPATGEPRLTAPGDAIEREADAMAREAMRAPADEATDRGAMPTPADEAIAPDARLAPAGEAMNRHAMRAPADEAMNRGEMCAPANEATDRGAMPGAAPTSAANPQASTAASLVIARDLAPTTTTPAEWPAADDAAATGFWAAAQAATAFGFAESEKAEAERVFHTFEPNIGRRSWSSVNAKLALYCRIADAEGGRQSADHGALVPIFANLLGLLPAGSPGADDALVLLWTNARTARSWQPSDVEAIYRAAVREPLATQLPVADLATALGEEGEYFDIAPGFWSSKTEQVLVLPGFRHFKAHAPAEWQSAAGFAAFAEPICHTPTVDRVVDMVVREVANRGWLDMPLSGTLFWAGGNPAQTLATMMSGYNGISTPIDSARTRINWESPPRGATMGTINNGPLAPILNTSPLWSLKTPNDFDWNVGGEIFFQGLSKVLATGARGIAHVLLVGPPRDNAIFLTHELPELIELKNRPVPLITGLDFLCFPRERTIKRLARQSGAPISELLARAPDDAPEELKRNSGLETDKFREAEDWMNMQSGSEVLENRLATLRAQWEAAGTGGTGPGPVVTIPLGDRGEPGSTVDITEDLPTHPGLEIERVHVEVSEEGTVASGSISASISAGDIEIPNVTYDLTPATGEVDATVSNSVADHTQGRSPFGDLLAGIPVDWDVHVITGGLGVSLALTQPIPLPGGLSISAAEGVLSYTGGDGLVGTISVTVTNGGTITGTVELGYRDGHYRIGGTLQVSGLIEGLAPFAIEMDYGGPEDWRVGLDSGSSLSVSTHLFGVPVSGVIEQLEMGSANRLSTTTEGAAEGAAGSQTGFSASGSLTADLPLIGPVEAGVRIVNSQLDTLSLTAERGFRFPAGDPIVTGNVTGTAAYHVQAGVLEGGLSGDASVNVPGIDEPVAVTFALAAGPAGFTVDASLVGEVEINRFLRLISLSASYQNGQLTLAGGAAVQNLGSASGNIAVRIDQTGIHVEQASALVSFGDENLGGEATFRYSETDGFGFDGHLDIQVLPGKRIRLSIAYPSEGEGGVGEDGTFDASVTLPPPEGGEGVGSAGWELWAGVQPAAPTPLFTAPHVTIPIFSIGLATATIEIDAALLYTLAVDPLTVAGSLAVEGIDLANAEQPFRKITVTGTAQSGITGQLIFEPSVALGLSVVHPFLAGIRGGLQLPVTATAGLDIQGDVALEFLPGGGLSADQATVTAPLSFGVVATPHLFAQLEALGGIIAPPAWQSDDLAELTLFEDRKLLEVVFDLAHPDRGITVHTFDPAAPASSEPAGMPMTPREPTMTPGSATAASLAGNAPVSTTTSDGAAATSGGGMDFSALLTAVSGAMPQPVQDLITTLQSIWTTISPIVNQVIEFLNWISATIRSIFTDEEVQRLLTQVLPQLASGNLSNIADAVRTAIDIGRGVVQKLVAPLVQSGDVSVMRSRKDRGAFGWDEGDPDEYSYRFHIPGLLDLRGQGSDAALSAMVMLLRDQLGVPVRDLDDVQPPHMIGYYEHNNAEGDIIGSSSDGAQTLRGGEQFHHDCMSSVKAYGVTPGTTLHLYEHNSSEGDYTRITFNTAPEPEPTVDANGLPQRKPPTITVNIGSGGDNASWVVVRGSQLNDKVSTVVITSDTTEPSR